MGDYLKKLEELPYHSKIFGITSLLSFRKHLPDESTLDYNNWEFIHSVAFIAASIMLLFNTKDYDTKEKSRILDLILSEAEKFYPDAEKAVNDCMNYFNAQMDTFVETIVHKDPAILRNTALGMWMFFNLTEKEPIDMEDLEVSRVHGLGAWEAAKSYLVKLNK